MGNAQIEIARAFDSVTAKAINKARMDHLASLGLDLHRKTVLEVGAGVGHLAGFWEDRFCDVLSTEGRKLLVRVHRNRHPGRKVRVIDLSNEAHYNFLSPCDIVFCYGTLYHIGDPAMVIENLALLCNELFLLSTRVNHDDNSQANLARDSIAPNQSIHGMGCRPGRRWIMAELQKHFEYVYITVTQPDHKDFVEKWPTNRKKVRAVFVASRRKLDLSTLTTELPKEQEKLKT